MRPGWHGIFTSRGESNPLYMADDKKKPQEEKHDNPVSQPDPETLHKTDPQDNMKGPLSSTLNKAKENIEEKGGNDADESESKSKK